VSRRSTPHSRIARFSAGTAARAADCGIPRPVAATGEDIARLLARVPVFSTLAADELARVAAVAVPRRFDAGEVVFREGDSSDTCYIVRSGQARAVREHADGRSITLSNFGPGDIFGELAMFDDERRSATVEVLENTEAVAILGPDMRRLLREHPDIAVKLIQALGRSLRETNERLARQSFQTVQSRVAAVLSQLVQARRAGGVEDRDVLITATQADLAQLAGSSRESASRFLAVLERAGIITQGRGKLVVHDAAALERYVY
jgi:CRP/FNR family transcriptional regulator, cyclic AMP receptor protein